jgi:hypothetical protein
MGPQDRSTSPGTIVSVVRATPTLMWRLGTIKGAIVMHNKAKPDEIQQKNDAPRVTGSAFRAWRQLCISRDRDG